MRVDARATESKLPDVGVSIFSVMSRLAAEHGAINLSQGFPDFDCDPEILALVTEHLERGHNQYSPSPGVVALREAIAGKVERLYGARYDPANEITVTCGATEALFCIISAFVRPGDEVVLFEPSFDTYVPVIALNGGIPVFVTLRYPEYRIDWSEVRRALSPRTRLILINSPHNPTGMVLGPDDLRELASALDGSDIVVLSDEVYEHVVFDGVRHETVSRHPDLAARSCVVSSMGKTYHATGWRVGYVVAPERLSREVQKIHQFVTFAANTPAQHACADYMTRHQDEHEVGRFYQEKRDRFLALLEPSRFRPIACHGTYFQLLDHSDITDEHDHAFALRLLKEHGVAAIPTSPFIYRSEAPPVLRFCFAKKEDTLVRAAERLRAI